MQGAVSDILEISNQLKDRPAYVSFHREPVEDVPASKLAGRMVSKDRDLVYITQPGSKDIFKQEIPAWLDELDFNVRNGRMPQVWAEKYREAHQRWLRGQEIPLNGTPVKGWGVISPAQQENLISANVMTVEDLAVLNDDGMRRIGMGALSLKQKAQAWLSQMTDKGPLTMEVSALKNENALLKANVETLTKQLQELAFRVNESQVQPQNSGIITPYEKIDIAEVLPDEYEQMAPPKIPDSKEALVMQYEAKYGKKPHHLMKPETIAARINQGVA